MQKVIQTNVTNITNKLLYILPGCAVAILAVLYIAQKISFINNANAVSYTTTAEAQFSVMSGLDLSITLPSSTVLDITPTADGAFNSGDIDVTVHTNNDFGYSLVMNAYDPITSAATTSLKRTTSLSGEYPTISSIGSSFTAAQFASSENTINKWGYSNDDGENFAPITASTVINNAGAQGTHTETVTFGAKVNDDIPFGSYSVTLNFVLTATPPAANSTSFDLAFAYAGAEKYNGYYKMQDMSSTVCGYVYQPSTRTDTVQTQQLIDVRDGNVYWVAKLGDGNCWMTQNLDFSINSSTAQYLTSKYTNISAEASTYTTAPYTTGYAPVSGEGYKWTPDSSYYTINASTTGAAFTWSNNYNNPESVDLGNWYYRDTYYNNDDCGDQGCNYHTSASGVSAQFSQTPYASNGQHGHVGNYYNWSAAVASSDTSALTTTATVKNSLCPAGWSLPQNGMYGTLNSFYNPGIETAKELGSTAAADQNLLASPLYLVRAGSVYSSALHDAGRYGVYWSSTVINSSRAYHLGFRSSGVWPAYNSSRNDGWSLRCVAAS